MIIADLHFAFVGRGCCQVGDALEDAAGGTQQSRGAGEAGAAVKPSGAMKYKPTARTVLLYTVTIYYCLFLVDLVACKDSARLCHHTLSHFAEV